LSANVRLLQQKSKFSGAGVEIFSTKGPVLFLVVTKVAVDHTGHTAVVNNKILKINIPLVFLHSTSIPVHTYSLPEHFAERKCF
jgi:hypothetical protein